MVGRKRKTCDEGSQRSWICQLPDVLISDILTRVPTKSAVRTGALSRTWMNHWKSVHGLDLDSFEFLDMDTFVSFVGSFFDTHRESVIEKIRLGVHYSGCKSLLTQWTDIATRRKIKHLDVCYFDPCSDVLMPVSIYTCKTLVHLRLSWVGLANFKVVSLPCLKIMQLECIRHLTEPTVEKLILGSPVLEDLTIFRETSGERSIEVRSNTLKRIHIDSCTEVVIEAPLLQYLRTRIYSAKNFKIINLGCSTTLDIDSVYPHVTCTKRLICDIITDIPRFRGLVTSRYILRDIFRYSEPGPLLQFRDLSRLRVEFSKSDLEMLPAILESCPKLQSLILELIKDPRYKKKNREPKLMFSTVPPCLVSSLKVVEWIRSTPRYRGEVELVRYFLENSQILEKLRLDTYYTKRGKRDFLKKVIALPKCSSACEIIVP
ncbi:F-box/FBD/LRR-repeat protein [Raphanus sativus]|nr:PREDICTED: F-box/FBD/LRR-repeat protein At1g51370-like [Raphanus sativus]KAJ4907575.1 F-box/FBD/LRR-repeat protein [Raphanus sativus]